VPSRRPHPHCTPFPPHEQLLVAAVGVAMLVVVVAMVVPRRFALSLLRSRTPYTPREQLLTAVVGVLVVVSVKGLVWGVVWAVVCLSFPCRSPPPCRHLVPPLLLAVVSSLPPRLLTSSLSWSVPVLPASSLPCLPRSPFVFHLPPPLILVGPIPPAIHPTSSCS
jgi:hypothetical protein